MTAARRTWTRITIAALVLAALALALAAHWVTFDHYGSTYGVSAGSNTHYCSAELVTGGIMPHPALSCQAAR